MADISIALTDVARIIQENTSFINDREAIGCAELRFTIHDNTLSREKEEFISIQPNRVGSMFVDPLYMVIPIWDTLDLPSFLMFYFDIYKGYAVRYVRHLENDADDR